MILGLTGGLGCGKTAAARGFEKEGFRRIDSDAIVREQVLVRADVQASLRDTFGDAVFSADGTVNRVALGARVFADDLERTWLEHLLHPHVFEAWRQALASDPGGRWAVEAPLLFEGQLENWFDFTICVACAPEQQLTRLEQRGMPRSLAGVRISKQLPLARKIELADFVLWNDGVPEFLHAEIRNLIASIPPSC